MKKLTASLGIAYMTLLSATAQTIDLFNWAGKDIIPKEQFITFYEKDTTGYTAIEKKYPLYKYQETDITSSNGKHQYKISTGSFSPQEEMGNAYEYFDISNNGKRIMREWGKALLWDVRLLTMDKNDRAHYIKVPLDNDSFALLFAGCIFDGDEEAGEMIIVVVNQDKATVVFDRPAFACAFTPAPNFAIEFTEKVSYTTIVLEGLEMPGDIIPAPNATKHKIWKEGNMLKYKKWN